MAAAAAGGSAAGGLVGGLFQVGLASQAWKNSKNARRWMYERHKESLKRDPSRMVEGLKLAGLNPVLLASGGFNVPKFSGSAQAFPAPNVGVGGLAAAGAKAGAHYAERDVRDATVTNLEAQANAGNTAASLNSARGALAAQEVIAKKYENQMTYQLVHELANDENLRKAMVRNQAIPGYGSATYVDRAVGSPGAKMFQWFQNLRDNPRGKVSENTLNLNNLR